VAVRALLFYSRLVLAKIAHMDDGAGICVPPSMAEMAANGLSEGLIERSGAKTPGVSAGDGASRAVRRGHLDR
jgi:hypothetical protein